MQENVTTCITNAVIGKEEQRFILENRQLLWKIKKVNREHRKNVEREVAALGIHPSQHHLLMYLSDNGQSTQSSIAAAMEVSSPTIAVSLKKLEKGGYIKKKMDSADNRFNRIVLTPKGEDVVSKSKQLFDAIDGRLLSGFSEEDKERLSGYLDRLLENL